MQQPSSLLAWFNHQVAQQGVAPRSTLLLLTALKTVRGVALMAAFWFIAGVLANWVTDSTLMDGRSLTFIILTLAVAWITQGIHIRVLHNAKQQLSADLESRLMDHFVCQQHALVRQRTGYYWQTVWVQHLPALVDWRYDYLVQQRVAVFMPLITLIAIGVVNGVIALSLLLTLPVVPLFMVIVGKGAAHLHRKHFVALERLGGLFTDRLKALPLLATFQGFDKQTTLLQQASEQLNARTMKVVGVAFLSSTVLDFFSTLAVALVAVFIGFSLLGEVNLGIPVDLHDGLWILLTVPMLLAEMKLLGQFYHQKAQAEAAREELDELATPLIECHVGQWHKPFAGAHFSHFSMKVPALRADDVDIEPVDWIRLHGPSGAGKTVFLEALTGLRDASHRLDANFVLLTQNVVVLPYTLRENLCLGQAFSDDQLWEVLVQVQLTPWAHRLPQQLDTLMGEHPPLSGGEAQRLAIARMLLRDADVWLLDEPTAHLSESQHHSISELLRVCCADKTVIWASHKSLPDTWFDQHWELADGVLSC